MEYFHLYYRDLYFREKYRGIHWRCSNGTPSSNHTYILLSNEKSQGERTRFVPFTWGKGVNNLFVCFLKKKTICSFVYSLYVLIYMFVFICIIRFMWDWLINLMYYKFLKTPDNDIDMSEFYPFTATRFEYIPSINQNNMFTSYHFNILVGILWLLVSYVYK